MWALCKYTLQEGGGGGGGGAIMQKRFYEPSLNSDYTANNNPIFSMLKKHITNSLTLNRPGISESCKAGGGLCPPV